MKVNTVIPCPLAASALAVLSALAALLGQSPAAGEEKKAAQGSKRELTAESFSKLHALIRPHEKEWRHLKVQWITDVVAARKKATKEDKPIVVLYTGGAGYNEPLGVC